MRVGTQTETGEGPPTDDIQAALTVIGRRKSEFNLNPAVRQRVGIFARGVAQLYRALRRAEGGAAGRVDGP